ncbi:MAG TPA: GNAT family N-acetyltransferase, partial [Acidimicrobiia bacterium]
MTYPSELELDVVLRDGEVVHLRPIRPDDADLERRFFAHVSPDSSYFRFFRYKRELTDQELAYFVTVDYRDRMAFVALAGEEMIAVGRYDLLETENGRRVAEVAFLVEDRFQGRGVGTLLLQHLAFYARLHDIAAFRAFVLSDNRSMLNVFRDSGYEVVREDLRRGIYELELDTSYSDQARTADAGREQKATAASLDALFRPRSVAVIGASRDEDSIGGRLLGNLLMTGFRGPVYPINPSADVVRSVKAYPSVLDVPGPVDLALIVVPASAAVSVVEECALKGVKAVVVISAGFAETGPAGIRLEAQLLDVVREGGMRMVGPNCMGLLNTDPDVRLNAQFGPVFPPAGNVAMSSQSGALGLAILDYAREINIGISSFVSVGNKADVSGNDLLLYWEDDPDTDVILLYLESFGNPRRFARLARRIGRKKPIAAVKSGRSATGARAAASHTGSLANVEVAVEALFRQTGVIRVDTLNELFDVTALLANQPVPGGRRVAVLTNAGGPAVLCADVLEAEGLDLPTLSEELQARLRKHLPAEASTRNPIDMIGSAGPEQYEACLRELLGSDEADAVIVIYIPATPGGGARVAEAIRGIAHQA